MKKAKEAKQAFALYVHEGLSLRKIAAQLDVSRSSLEKWCRQGGWVQKRKEHWLSASQELCSNKVYEHIGGKKSVVGELEKLLHIIHSQQMAYYEGKIPRSALKYSVRDLCRVAVSINQIGLQELQRAGVAEKIIT